MDHTDPSLIHHSRRPDYVPPYTVNTPDLTKPLPGAGACVNGTCLCDERGVPCAGRA